MSDAPWVRNSGVKLLNDADDTRVIEIRSEGDKEHMQEDLNIEYRRAEKNEMESVKNDFNNQESRCVRLDTCIHVPAVFISGHLLTTGARIKLTSCL